MSADHSSWWDCGANRRHVSAELLREALRGAFWRALEWTLKVRAHEWLHADGHAVVANTNGDEQSSIWDVSTWVHNEEQV